MHQTNRLNCPVFSCVWLAGIVLAGTVSADDGPSCSIKTPSRIISHRAQESKSQFDGPDIDFEELTEGILIARRNSHGKSSHPKRDENNLPPSEAEKLTSPANDRKQDAQQPSDQHPASDVGYEPLFRPLSAIDLASSTRSESVAGASLKKPNSEARSILAVHGTWLDISGYRPTPFPRHNYSRFAHNPLYFEDPNLERLGHGDGCFTEIASAAHFFGRMPLLPYMIGSNKPHSCVPSLGNYSPCCAYGHNSYIPPLNAPGVALQAACTVGLVFLIP